MPQYQGVWTLQQQMQALTSGQWATDPNFKNTTLLLQADNAANSAQNNTFLDSSTNAFAITRNGNTTQGTFSPFSATGWSNYFDGNASCDLAVASTAQFNWGTSDFCIEAFVYPQSFPTAARIINFGDGIFNFEITSSGFLSYYQGTSYNATVGALPLNTWTHCVITRQSGTIRMFANGILVFTNTNTTSKGTSTANIGSYPAGGDTLLGYLSNLRVINGNVPAVYQTSSTTVGALIFTPPDTSLTAVSGTALLTCQANRFIDNSGNNLSITVGAGTPSVQAFSPFAPQFQYTASGTGGSGYFDGGGDFLTVASNSAFDFPGNATVELWIYFTGNMGVRQDIIHHASNGFEILKLSGDTIYCGFGGGTITSSITVKANQWYHIALVRSSTGASGLNLYINGANVGSATAASSVTSGTMAIGAQATGNQPVSGYMSSLRIVKGTAVYTAAFTPPTAPTTAISGTSLLLNFTNAGILDGTMKNNLETVGNAQVSTSVVKYGSGSMYFDGSGDYLVSPTSPVNALGTANFTVEGWFYCTGYNGGAALYSGLNTYPASTGLLLYISSAGAYVVDVNGSNVISTGTAPLNTWVHYALVRNNGTLALYINGTSIATAASTTNFSSQYLTIGRTAFGTASNYFLGYLDDLRITQGIARYTQNFIPPSVALPRQ